MSGMNTCSLPILVLLIATHLSLGFVPYATPPLHHGVKRARASKLFSSSIAITIPQRHTSDSSPVHQNTYPSPLHTIHIAPLLTPDQASKCLQLAKQYAEASECWSAKDSDRHSSYSTADFPVEDCDALQSYLDEIGFESKTFDLIGGLFPVDAKDLWFMDLFCAHYSAKGNGSNTEDGDGTSVMDRLDPHRDGSIISFTIVLSSPEDYEGGGTEFQALCNCDDGGEEYDYDEYSNVLDNGVIKVSTAGEGVIHCGKIFHGAHVVKMGERTTLTGFVNVDDRCVRPGVLGNACKNWGRMDNANKRMERQIKMAGESSASDSNNNNDDQVAFGGWVTTSPKYMDKSDGSTSTGNSTRTRTHLEGFIPAFSSVKRRGSEGFQRKKNLEAEDILLRDILLPEDERVHPSELFDLSEFGDITIL